MRTMPVWPGATRPPGFRRRRYVHLVVADWRRRLAVIVGVLVVLGSVGVGAYFLVDSLRDNEKQPAPAPSIVVHEQQAPATQDLGFPAFATKNTNRVAGLDPVADAAGVALAVFPSAGGVTGPAAVSLVEDNDWASGIAAASLAAQPIRAPILLTGTDDIPDFTAEALSALAPAGSAKTDGKQIFAIGSVTTPHDLEARRITGSTPAEIAAEIDELRQKLTGDKPQHIVLASSDQPAYAMPAAAWAARSGDPVLFVSKGGAPKPTLAALRRDKRVPVYVLGPASVISDKALEQVRKVAPDAQRVGAEDPVENAVTFARYASGSFGWDVNDPGHGFVIASAGRPLDAAAAAPLSASGDWGPLLITDDPGQVPATLRGYLLDVKPGYVNDPTRAVYNHVWLIGDQGSISVGFQSQVDDLAELVQVRSGSGGGLGPPPGTPEHEQGKP
jgi:Cell wall binding domain 2 (CWB2)